MKKISLIAFTICLMFTACNSDEIIKAKDPVVTKDEQSEESKNLEKMYDEIVALSGNTKTCTNNNDWDFIGIGSQSCGGPEKYIIYSLKINTTDFLAKVRTYTAEQEKFDIKWKISSTCDIVPVPESVDCVDGKPTLIYGSDRKLEDEKLKTMYREIITLSGINRECETYSGNDWDFISIGSNPCGGPEKYIPYYLKINTTDFLDKVRSYTAEQRRFNQKWKIVGNCEFVTEPELVNCVNGKATLLYRSDRILEQENLTKMYNEIVALSDNTKTCRDSNDWDFVAVGSKICGGPQIYIPYSLKINVPDFLAKVNLYTVMQNQFNFKWKLLGNCEFIAPPKSVECVNEKATLMYE